MNTSLWNTYSSVREKLDAQFRQNCWTNGKNKEELEQEAWKYIKDNKSLARIRLKAEVFSFILRNAGIRVDDFDFFAGHIDGGGIPEKIRESWRKEAEASVSVPDWKTREAANATLDLSHTSPGWPNLLRYGICGIRDRALHKLETAKDPESREFYEAIVTVYEAIRVYILRLAEEAERINAIHVIDVLRNIAVRAPETFHEALQVSWIYSQMQELEGEWVRTQGIFDHLYINYYRNDLKNGRLTRNQAKELIAFYFDKYSAQHWGAGHNICLGGMNPDSSDSCNELTELVLEVFEERGNIDPKLSLRVHRNINEKILIHATRCVPHGTNALVFANDEVAYPMFLKRGKKPEDLIDFVPVGCYEPAIMGKELCCSMSATVNMLKPMEYLFDELDNPFSPDEVFEVYKKLLRNLLEDTLNRVKEWERLWPEINPSPVMSGTMDGCFEKGRDVSRGGTVYNNSGVMCAGLGSLVDSMEAIKYLVFEKKLCSWSELGKILADNWNGYEDLRLQACKHAKKWGNNVKEADETALEISNYAASIINNTPNARGGSFQMGCWSIDYSVTYGKQTGATANGRKKGEPIAKNLGASIGADSKGITALIHSAAKLNHTEFPDGSVLDIMLHPSVLKGIDGAKLIADMIRTYFKSGGLFIQFNIFDADILKDACKNPENYRNLQVRVCGWNSRFVDLSPEMQATFIAQAEAL